MRRSPSSSPSAGFRKGIAILPVALILLATLVASGCAATGASTAPATPAGSVLPAATAGAESPAPPAPAGSPAATPSTAPGFPITLTDDLGAMVRIPAPPQRIVSLAPSVTETLFALGAGSMVVGVTDADDYPPEAKALPHVATYAGVELEKVVAARPDVVIAWKGITQAADVTKMRALGLVVVMLYATTVRGVLDDISLVGQATGSSARAADLVGSMSRRIDAIAAAATATSSRPRVFYELDATKAIYGLAPDDFTTDLVRLAGGDPITSGTPGVYAISLETLVAADPEVIVLGDAAYGTTAAAVAGRPGWATMTAVRSHAIRPIDDVVVTRPGPRIVDGLAALAIAIHPGMTLPAWPAATTP